MRLAVTGTHGVGKTTLIEDFLARRPEYLHLQEPYWEMVQQGAVFGDPPTIEDMEDQMKASVAMILGCAGAPDVIMERCPLDFIAYLEAMSDMEGAGWEPTGQLLGRIEKALRSIDLVVLLPFSAGEPVDGRSAYPELRRSVAARLNHIVRDDALGLLDEAPRVLEVSGTPAERLAQLLDAVGPGTP